MNVDIMVLAALSGMSMAMITMLCATWYYEISQRII